MSAWWQIRHEWHDCGERYEDCTDPANMRRWRFEPWTCFKSHAYESAQRDFTRPADDDVIDTAGLFMAPAGWTP